MTEFDDRGWAAAEAARLRSLQTPIGNQWIGPTPMHAVTGHLAAAQEYLQRMAPGSSFTEAAKAIAVSKGDGRTALEQMASLLDQFEHARHSGLVRQQPFEVRARLEAATDLMEQVATLLADKSIHPAAPVMLAGAALEEHLRSLWIGAGEPKLNGKPGINSYTMALRAAECLTRNDEKNITAIADLRNDAAHGHLDAVDRPRAEIMVAQVNLFLQQHGG